MGQTFLLFPKNQFVLLNVFCSIQAFVQLVSLYVSHSVWSVHLIFLSLSCHFWFLSSTILFCMPVVNTFLFNLCREFPVFLICFILWWSCEIMSRWLSLCFESLPIRWQCGCELADRSLWFLYCCHDGKVMVYFFLATEFYVGTPVCYCIVYVISTGK